MTTALPGLHERVTNDTYELLPPHTPLVEVQAHPPTTALTKPISMHIPLSSSTKVANILDVLGKELGLLSATPGLKGSRRTRRASSNTGAKLSKLHPVNSIMGMPGDDSVCWTVSAMTTAGALCDGLRSSDSVMDILSQSPTAFLVVRVNQEWLYERLKMDANGEQDDHARGASESESDTLRAYTLKNEMWSTVQRQMNFRPPPFGDEPSSSTRLSGLFHGWLEANQHPVPPSTPQLTLERSRQGVPPALDLAELQDALNTELSGVKQRYPDPNYGAIVSEELECELHEGVMCS